MSLELDYTINKWLLDIDIPKNTEYINKLLYIGYEISQLGQMSINSNSNILKPLENKINTIDTNCLNTCDKMSSCLELYQSKINLLENILKSLNVNIDKQYEDTNEQYKFLSSTIQKLTGDINTSSIKGKIGENYIENVLKSSFPDDVVDVTALTGHEADLHLKSTTYPTLLIESKCSKHSVGKKEIQKFVNDLDSTGIDYGVFISLTSSINGHKRLEYKCINGKHVMFIPNAGFESLNIIYGVLFLREIGKTLKNNIRITEDIMEEKCEFIYNSLENLDLIFENITRFKSEIVRTKTLIDTQMNHLVTNILETEISTKDLINKMKVNISNSLSDLYSNTDRIILDNFDEIIQDFIDSDIKLNKLIANSLLLFKNKHFTISKNDMKYHIYDTNQVKMIELKVLKTKGCYDFIHLGLKYDIKIGSDIIQFNKIVESII